jgi:hypothetical protein
MTDELERIPLRAVSTRLDEKKRISPKRLGEVAEATLLTKTQKVGLGIAKPWGDSDSYDYIIDSGWKRWRTQVKCSASKRDDGYQISPSHRAYGKGKTLYTLDDIDLLVVYIFPHDTWYVLPIEDILGARTLIFFPDGGHPRAHWEQYREAWHLLTEPCSRADCPRSDFCRGLKDWRKCFLDGVGMDAEIFCEQD